MACQLCQVKTRRSLCQVCQYLNEMTPPKQPVLCRQCRAPVARPEQDSGLCQVCHVLLDIVSNSLWFNYVHAEWEQENWVMAKRKRDLMG